jgi:hypothetical protein
VGFMDACARVLFAAMVAAFVAGEDLDALFRRADRDPAALVPLIHAASTAVAAAPTDTAIPIADRLAPYARRVFLAPGEVPGMERVGMVMHAIARGETLSGIARRHRIGTGLVSRLNPTRGPLVVGRGLKLLDATAAPVSVVISLHRYRLLAWRGKLLLASFPVSVGKPATPTPLGETVVAVRARDPEWRDPDTGRLFAPRDPGNVLGGYWLGFDPLPERRFRGIGIHGFTAERPETWLETASSHGCIRLAQEDIAVLFDLALPGAKVVVRP